MFTKINTYKTTLLILIALVITLGRAWPSYAHPHILIDATIKLSVNPKQQLTKLTYIWQFDENFSLLLLGDYDEDKDKDLNHEELTTLVNETMEGAHELGYFTHLKDGKTSISLRSASQVLAKLDANRLTFQFDLELLQPQKISQSLTFSLFDEEYYSAFMIDYKTGYEIDQPQATHCKITQTKTAKTDENIQNALDNAFNEDTINQGSGSQFANIIGMKC